MRHKTPVSIVAVVVALAALAGAASASASEPVLSAESYPVKLTGAGNVDLKIYGTMGVCSITFQEEMEELGETLAATPFGSCKSYGVSNPIKANGCKFEFHPESDYYRDGEFEGTFDIGPANCGPLTVKLYGCEVSIGAQSGYGAIYRNIELGTTPGVEIEPDVSVGESALEYTTSGWTCGGTGTYSDGVLQNGSWKFEGETIGEVPELTGISYLEEAHEPMLEAAQYPVALGGHQDEATPYAFGFENGLTASCDAVTSAGEASGASTAFGLTQAYSGCEAFGFFNAEVKTNGCSFSYEVEAASGEGYDGAQALTCPGEAALEVKGATCTVSIPAQSLGAVEFGNGTETGHDAVSVASDASGLTYTVSKDGIGCPLSGKGTRTTGTYAGSSVLHGAEVGSPENLIDVRIGS